MTLMVLFNKKLFVLTLFLITNLNAQYYEKIDSIFSPIGIKVESFSAPVFGDLDGDGDLDLFLGNTGNRVNYFQNIGTLENPKFVEDTSMLSSIYNSGGIINSDYPALVDINGDGLMDLVISGYNALQLFINRGTSTKPEWGRVDTVFANVNEQIGTDAKPVFVDIDNDGDYDLFVGIGESLFGGPTPGITMAFRNIGDAQNPNFVLDNSLATGIADVGLNAYPSFADIDGDGDYDLIVGRDVMGFYFYRNNGSATSPSWFRDFNILSSVPGNSYWNNPTLVDYNGDGTFDIIYGNADGFLIYYKNTRTVQTAQFQLQNNYFNVIKLADYSANVTLGDYDGDGLVDLVSGSTSGKFYLLKNTGSNSQPIFNLPTVLSGYNFGSFTTPHLYDLDTNGVLDLITGHLNGQVRGYYRYTSGNPVIANLFTGINVGYMSAPTFGDLNGDGIADMLISAEQGSQVQFYVGNRDGSYTLDNSFISGITFPSYGRSVLADVDDDGDFDIVIGRSNGTLSLYKNNGDKFNPVWVLDNNLFQGIKVRQSATPGFKDLDGDGKTDMIVGEYHGNFTFYKNLFSITNVENKENNLLNNYSLSQNYPNPFNPSTEIRYQIAEDSKVSLIIYDLLGNEVSTLVNEIQSIGIYNVTFNADNLSSGIYFYKLSASNGTKVFQQTKKMIYIK